MTEPSMQKAGYDAYFHLFLPLVDLLKQNSEDLLRENLLLGDLSGELLIALLLVLLEH